MTAKQTVGFILWMLLLLANNAAAQEASDPEPTASVQAESVSVPALADIIPLATELKGRLATLENKLKTGPNIEAVEIQYGQLEVDLKAFYQGQYRLVLLQIDLLVFDRAPQPLDHDVVRCPAWFSHTLPIDRLLPIVA